MLPLPTYLEHEQLGGGAVLTKSFYPSEPVSPSVR